LRQVADHGLAGLHAGAGKCQLFVVDIRPLIHHVRRHLDVKLQSQHVAMGKSLVAAPGALQ